MPKVMYVRELDASDAKAVACLERKVHKPKRRDGWKIIEQDLLEADSEQCNFSMGLFDGNRLVGYILAYVLEKGDENGEEIVEFDDLAMLPGYRRFLYVLLERFFNELRKFCPRHPLEAYSLRPELEKWRTKHFRGFEQLGYRFTRYENCAANIPQEERYRVRWEPVPRAAEQERKVIRSSTTTSVSYRIGECEYTVETIREEEDWTLLEPFWNRLLKDTKDHTVFQTFEYQRIWWRHFGLSRNLFILVIRRKAELIGIAPMQISPVKLLGRYYRELGLIGTRWEVDRPTFLFPYDPRECHEITLAILKDQQDCWDICRLYEQPLGGLTETIFPRAFSQKDYFSCTTRDSICPYLTFDSTWEEFWASKSGHFRKRVNAARKKLQAIGPLELRRYKDWPEVKEKLDFYRELEAKSWKSGQDVGISKNWQYLHFYQDLAAVFGKKNRFHLLFLNLASHPIAATIAFEYEEKYYSTQIVYDSALSKYSPGTVLEFFELQDCFKGGCREYDFLGGFLTQKRRWTFQQRRTVQVHVYRKSPWVNLFFYTHMRIKPLAIRALSRLGLLNPLRKLRHRLMTLQEERNRAKQLSQNKPGAR